MPSTINAGVTPSFQLIPKFYNGAKTSDEKIRINGRTQTIAPTINANGQAVFQLQFVASEGFINGANTVVYEFTVNGCPMTATKNVQITNLGAPVITLFTFIGSGNYNNPANWSRSIMPPNPLPAGSTIIINGSGACILNVPQTISTGATFRVEAGKVIRVNGNLQVQ